MPGSRTPEGERTKWAATDSTAAHLSRYGWIVDRKLRVDPLADIHATYGISGKYQGREVTVDTKGIRVDRGNGIWFGNGLVGRGERAQSSTHYLVFVAIPEYDEAGIRHYVLPAKIAQAAIVTNMALGVHVGNQANPWISERPRTDFPNGVTVMPYRDSWNLLLDPEYRS